MVAVVPARLASGRKGGRRVPEAYLGRDVEREAAGYPVTAVEVGVPQRRFFEA